MIRLLPLLLLLATPALADVQVAFSPGDAEQTVVQVIRSADRTIHLAAYSFTSRPVAQALIDAHGRGVSVQAVLDKSNDTARFTEAGELARAGVPVRIDSRYAIMHDKFMVIDGVTVETGSFNFTRAAVERNAENLVVLRDMPEVAARYDVEWQRLWGEGRDYPAGGAP